MMYVRTYVRMYVSVTLRNVEVTSRRNVANQRSNVIIIAWKEGGARERITSKRYSVGARLSGRTTDGLYVLLCRYIRSQATHRYISRSAASYEEPISSYSLELK